MKFLLLLGDGMADEPLDVLGNKTPLEFAHTPHMDRMAADGTLGLIETIPPGVPPGSDVGNLSVLGYDPRMCYTGRGPFEAASMGIPLDAEDVAFRCNLVTIADEQNPVMDDFTAGHISSREARQIIFDLDQEIGSETFRFYPGIGYRHLMVWKAGEAEVVATPPHDITGKNIGPFLPAGRGSDKILQLIQRAHDYLMDHHVNRGRIARGEKPATDIWLWGQGRAPRIKKITERFHLRGGVISAVDLLNGIGVYAGLEVLHVEGATGYTDTNYVGKAEKALSALHDGFDFIFVHVEAPDEMGHQGNIEGKVKAIEDFDQKVVGTILNSVSSLQDFRIAVLSDHPTPIRLKTHAAGPSPFAVLSSRAEENQAKGQPFGERNAKGTSNMISPGYQFLGHFLGNWRLFFESDTR